MDRGDRSMPGLPSTPLTSAAFGPAPTSFQVPGQYMPAQAPAFHPLAMAGPQSMPMGPLGGPARFGAAPTQYSYEASGAGAGPMQGQSRTHGAWGSPPMDYSSPGGVNSPAQQQQLPSNWAGVQYGGGEGLQPGDSFTAAARPEVIVSRAAPWGGGGGAGGGARNVRFADGAAEGQEGKENQEGEGGADGEKKPEAEAEEENHSYDGIVAGVGPGAQFRNDLIYFFRHYQRAGEAEGLLQSVASPMELEHIQAQTGLRHKVLVNMMVWRRSILKVMTVFLIVSTSVKIYNGYLGYRLAYQDFYQEPLTLSFEEWQQRAEEKSLPKPFDQYSGSFADYSLAIAFEVRRLMTRSSNLFTAVKQILMAMCSIVTLILVGSATFRWANLKLSRTRVTMAWYLSLGAPFVASMVPARLFVHWDQAAKAVDLYRVALEEQLALDTRLQQVQQACGMLRDEGDGKVEQVEDAANTLCKWVDKLPNGVVTIPFMGSIWNWNDWTKADFGPIHTSCNVTRHTINQGVLHDVVKSGKETCGQLELALDQYIANYGQTAEMVEYFTARVNTVVEASVALMLSIDNLAVLLPAALSVAPGLMKGAMRMKMLVPQSTIPGMFVMILPWLYCPMNWAIYSIIFQLVGNSALLIGLMVVAFSPVANALLSHYYEMERPKTDEEVLKASRAINRILLVICLVGYILIVIYLLTVVRMYARHQNYWGLFGGDAPDDWGAQKEGQLLLQLLDMTRSKRFVYLVTSNIALGICSALGNYYLTGCAGLDWMAERMVEERRIEREVHSVEIRREFDDRMDQLLSLDSGKRYSVWVADQWEAYNQRRKLQELAEAAEAERGVASEGV